MTACRASAGNLEKRRKTMKVFKCKCGKTVRLRKNFFKWNNERLALFTIKCEPCGLKVIRITEYDAVTA